MYHPVSLYHSTIPTCTDNNCIDFGIYGIEQNDCYLDLNCIEPSLIPEEQQAYTYPIATYNNNITTASSINDTMIDNTEQTTNRPSRRTIRKKRSKKDPNEPQKPVSAYALFFRDTQAAIKGRSPNASLLYKQRTEMAKKDYLKKLAAYRAQQISHSETVQPMSVSEKGIQIPMQTMNSASSSNLKQEASTTTGEMTLANLIARPPSTNFSSLYLHQRLNNEKTEKNIVGKNIVRYVEAMDQESDLNLKIANELINNCKSISPNFIHKF